MQAKDKLIRLLQDAHAGERAAAFAYNGHWRSVKGQERSEIQKIEREEWEHRAELYKMLEILGAKPRFTREVFMALVGMTIFSLCRIGDWLNVANFGWYSSMFGAGKLERGNIVEYEVAAKYAKEAGYPQFIDCLLTMAEVEWDHELYFRSQCLRSKWSKHLSLWPATEPRQLIRSKIKAEAKGSSLEIS